MIGVIALRIKYPEMPRPYRVPLGTKGLIAYAIPVVIICFYCIIFCSKAAMLGAVIFGPAAPITYFLFKKIYGGPDNIKENKKFRQ